MKIARFLWTAGSLYLLVLIIVYGFLLDPPEGEVSDRLAYILEHWALYDFQFKGEFVMGILISLSSFMFAVHLRRSEFILIGTGQLLYALAFPLVVSIYPNASTEVAAGISYAANSLVTFGLLLSTAGFFLLHLNVRVLASWLHVTAMIFAAIGFISFLLAFIGLIADRQAHMVMFLMLFLYLINAYYGLRLNVQNSSE